MSDDASPMSVDLSEEGDVVDLVDPDEEEDEGDEGEEEEEAGASGPSTPSRTRGRMRLEEVIARADAAEAQAELILALHGRGEEGEEEEEGNEDEDEEPLPEGVPHRGRRTPSAPIPDDDTMPLFFRDPQALDNDELVEQIAYSHDALVGAGPDDSLVCALAAYGITELGAGGAGERGDVAPRDLLHMSIERRHADLVLDVWALNREVIARGLPRTHDLGQRALDECHRMRDFLLASKNALMQMQRMARLSSRAAPDPTAATADFADLERGQPSEFQLLHTAILEEFAACGYRKERGGVFEEVVLPAGARTRAYRRKGDIDKTIQLFCAPERNPYIYGLIMNNHQFGPALLKTVDAGQSAMFPDLARDRHVFSFRNGVYLNREDRFVPYALASDELPSDTVSAKFFDYPFKVHPRKRDSVRAILGIPCPAIDKVLGDQAWASDPQNLIAVWAMLGRFQYDVGELDDWELYLKLSGFGGCGKSTVIEALQRLYEPENVATLGNDVSKQFGMAHAVGKFILLAPDINDQFGMSQNLLFSMISGEMVMLEQKYRVYPHEVPHWTAQIAVSTNFQLARCFPDRGGNQARREFEIPFRTIPGRRDANVKRAVRHQMAAFVLKSNRAYLFLVRATANLSQGEWLPPLFKERQREVQATSNTLHQFLDSCALEFGDELYCPFETFMGKYKQWRGIYGIRGQITFSPLEYTQPFAAYSIRFVRKENRMWPPGSANIRTSDWVVGCAPRRDPNE